MQYKIIGCLVFALCIYSQVSFGQISYTSQDSGLHDYIATGTWTRSPAAATPASPGNPTNSSASALRIYGYTRSNSGLTINNANPVVTVYDTLYIVGNVTLGSGARLNVLGSGLLVIVGNLTLQGSFNLTNAGNVVVTGSVSVTNGSITNTSDKFYVYGGTTASGGGTIDGCNPYGGCTPGSQVQTHAQLSSQNAPLEAFVGGGGVLPVELIFFRVAPDGKNFSWATASERNFDYFSLQHSTNGVDFQEVGRLAGQGTSSLRHEYNYELQSPIRGVSYYRLQMFDLDGTFEFSKLVRAEHNVEKTFDVNPNPWNGITFRSILNFEPNARDEIVVYDMNGTEHRRVSPIDVVTEYDMTTRLPSGVYFMKYKSADFVKVIRVVVKADGSVASE